jgi:Outer membrane protein
MKGLTCFPKSLFKLVSVRFGGLIMAVVIGSSPASASQLQQLFEVALANNPQLSAAEADSAAAMSDVQQAESEENLTVNLKSELSYAWMKESSFSRTANQLVATYPLYQPEQSDLNAAASQQHSSRQYQLDATRQQLLLQVALTYFRYWSQQEDLHFLQKERRSIESILQQVKQRFQVGYQDLNDIVEIQARLDMNHADALEARQSLERTRQNLAALLGVDNLDAIPQTAFGFPVDVGDEVTQLAQRYGLANSKNRQAWSELVSHHPSLFALQASADALRNEAEYRKNKDTFQLDAFGTLVYNDSGNHYYDDMEGARGGVQLTVPLYLGGRTESSVSKARHQSQKRLAQKREQQLKLEAEAKNAWLGLQTGVARVKALQSALVSNRAALKATEQGLQTGRRNILDLLNAQRSLHKTERDLPVLKAQIGEDLAKFYWAIGKMSEENNLWQK